MSQSNIQQPTYHSLHKHVHSITPQHQNYNQIYSSNRQPPLPSILNRSQAKKSHQKSLKKGISRVSKSLHKKSQTLIPQHHQNKEQLSKPKLLNFNLQEVIESKYHLTKPKDQVLKQPINNQNQNNMNQHDRVHKIEDENNNSLEQSFINQYRIVTYLPSFNEVQEQANNRTNKKSIKSSRQYNNQNQNQFRQYSQNQNKQNNLNQSNVLNKRSNHHKNQSESVQIINPTNRQNVLQLNTWRTSTNYDPIYSSNYNTQTIYLTGTNRMTRPQHYRGYSSNNNEYQSFGKINIADTQSQQKEMQTQRNEEKVVINQLKNKIKHLQHQIIEIQKQKSQLQKHNSNLIQDNQNLFKDNQFLKNQNNQLRTFGKENQHQIRSLESSAQHLRNQQTEKSQYLHQAQTKKHDTQSKRLQIHDLSSYKLTITPNRSKINTQLTQNQLKQQIEVLQLTNSKLSKQISEKNLSITQLIRKNKDLTEKLTDSEKQIKRFNQKLQSQQEKLYRKDQRINFLSLQIQRLGETKNNRQNIKVVEQQKIKSNDKDLLFEKIRQEKEVQIILREQLQNYKQKYEKSLRDYTHLEKKHILMIDQIEHLKYLQNSCSSSSSKLKNNYSSLDRQNTKNFELEQAIIQLQHKLDVNERNMSQVQEQYSNLKHNFRALQQLYIKQQNQINEIDQELIKVNEQNSKLKTQLSNFQQLLNTKKITTREDNEAIHLKFLQKQQAITKLINHNHLVEQNLVEIKIQIKQVQFQRDQWNQKYLQQLQKISQMSKRHKQDIQVLQLGVESQQKQKIQHIVNQYERLIEKLNLQKGQLKQQLARTQQNFEKKAREVLYCQTMIDQLKLDMKMKDNLLKAEERRQCQKCIFYEKDLAQIILEKEKLNEEINQLIRNNLQEKRNQERKNQNIFGMRKNDFVPEKQNNLTFSRSQGVRYHSSSKYGNQSNSISLNKSRKVLNNSINRINDIAVNLQIMNRKQLQYFTQGIQQEQNILEHRYKGLIIQHQRLQDNFKQSSRLLSHLQQQISFYKQQKQQSIQQKLDLCEEMQNLNTLVLQLKKNNKNNEEQNQKILNQIDRTEKQLEKEINLNKKLERQLIELQNIIHQKQIAIQRHQTELRVMRIQVLQEKQISQKYKRQVSLIEEQKQAFKSKEQYYKMLFQKAQRDLQSELQQKSILISNLETKKSVSPAKLPQKYIQIDRVRQFQISKDNKVQISNKKQSEAIIKQKQSQLLNYRQKQLYRVQIYKDFNKLLNLSSHNFSLQQIIQTNESSYLDRLYSTCKQQITKTLELKNLIIEMQESFKDQKIKIKQDYDLVYEKYLKYKSMCTLMEKDIQRYKIQIQKIKLERRYL